MGADPWGAEASGAAVRERRQAMAPATAKAAKTLAMTTAGDKWSTIRSVKKNPLAMPNPRAGAAAMRRGSAADQTRGAGQTAHAPRNPSAIRKRSRNQAAININ